MRRPLLRKLLIVAALLLMTLCVTLYHTESIRYDFIGKDPMSVDLKDFEGSQQQHSETDKGDAKTAKKVDSEKLDHGKDADMPNLDTENDIKEDSSKNSVGAVEEDSPKDPENVEIDASKGSKEDSFIEDAKPDASNESKKLDDASSELLEEESDKIVALRYINEDAEKDTSLPHRLKFFETIFNSITEFKPDVEPLKKYKNDKNSGEQGSDSYNDDHPYTLENLSGYLEVTKDDIQKLKKVHESFIEALPTTYPSSTYKKLKGIVYVGGSRFSWLTLVSIMNLRHVGSELPVEILIPNIEEYELDLCQNVFPKYNARCIYLPKLVGEKVFKAANFKGYQYKALALALSSFDEVLLLDADNTPLKDPAYVFEAKPYDDTGLILWPDYWQRTTHPAFYEIAGIDIDETKRASFGYKEYGKFIKPITPDDVVLLHQLEGTLPNPSTESGEIFYSKKKHFKAMLLTLYYNMYGPNYFYPLFSQGAPGEGDKETFIAGAHVLGDKYHTVIKHVHTFGRHTKDGFKGSAMGQYDPVEDLDFSIKYKDKTEYVENSPSILFLHANFPKLDPWKLYHDEVIVEKSTGERNRLFGVDFIDEAKYDFEYVQWDNMKRVLCDEKLTFKNFQSQDVETDQVCREVKEQLEFLKKTTRSPK